MGGSRVIRMPAFTKLDIPVRQRLLRVTDKQIFCDLRNRYRQIGDQDGGAAKGDYVLVDVTDSRGAARTLHIELGGKCYPELEKSLIGCKAGQNLHTADDTVIQVRSVRKVIEFPLTDASIASLNIPGAGTLAAYRRRYIQEHGGEIAERLFRAIQKRLMDDLLAMAEISLDADDVDLYHKRQLTMLQNISGNVEERLRQAYGDGGAKTPEECRRQFYEDNKRSFCVYLLGKAMAEQDHAAPTEAEYRQALEYYCLIFEKTEEQVEQEGLKDEVLRSYYLQYGIHRLWDYYKSIVCFSADGISSQPLESGTSDPSST